MVIPTVLLPSYHEAWPLNESGTGFAVPAVKDFSTDEVPTLYLRVMLVLAFGFWVKVYEIVVLTPASIDCPVIFSVVVDSADTDIVSVILLMIGIEMRARTKKEIMPRKTNFFLLMTSMILFFYCLCLTFLIAILEHFFRKCKCFF